MLVEQLIPPAQDGAAVLGGAGRPGLLGRVGHVDGPPGLLDAQVGDAGDDVAGGGVGDVEGGAGVGVDPLAPDVRLRPQECRITQFHGVHLSMLVLVLERAAAY